MFGPKLLESAVISPKLSVEQRDGKLAEIRGYVREHVAEIASREKSSLRSCFAAKKSEKEKQFYKFLYMHEAGFTEAQQRYVGETMSLLTQHRKSSGGVHPG